MMEDIWGDTIEILPGWDRGTVEVIFYGSEGDDMPGMVFDQKKARQFIDKLIQAFEEDE